jgi:hypothetical protein
MPVRQQSTTIDDQQRRNSIGSTQTRKWPQKFHAHSEKTLTSLTDRAAGTAAGCCDGADAQQNILLKNDGCGAGAAGAAACCCCCECVEPPKHRPQQARKSSRRRRPGRRRAIKPYQENNTLIERTQKKRFEPRWTCVIRD